MKVGIISMQRVPNYGSFLQAYGLKTILEELGHEVCFVDYKVGKPVVHYNRMSLLKYKILNTALIRMLSDRINYYFFGRKEFVYEYRMFYLKEIGIGYMRKNANVDVAVIGSDEVFNCLQNGFNVGFSPMLFGQDIHARKVISYAASFGYTDIDGLKKYGIMSRISEYLNTFSAISVRDENSLKIIESLTGNRPEINLDPVLVANYEMPQVDISCHNFVLLYTYKSRKYTDEEKNTIKDFCKSNNKILISIGNSQEWVDLRVHASPFELLAYINAADFIITDTFHGSVFSIKYNKKFATLIRDDNKQKLTDLLQRLRQQDRVISSFENLQIVYDKQVDFTETNVLIENEKEYTLEYLHRNLV